MTWSLTERAAMQSGGSKPPALLAWTASSLVFALFLLYTAYHNLQIFQNSRLSVFSGPRPEAQLQGPFILRASTPLQTNCSAPLAPYSYTIDTGPGLFTLSQEDPNLLDVLFARLQGPEGRHFSCFLERKGTKPVGGYGYLCPQAVHLPAGLWNVSVLLYRRQCVALDTDIGLLQHIIADSNKFSDFDQFLGDVGYPPIEYKKDKYPRPLHFQWDKKEENLASSSSSLGNNEKEGHTKGSIKQESQCSSDSSGMWQQLPTSTDGTCQPPLCSGQLDTDLFNKPYNKQIGLHHIFKPFSCSYHCYTKEEARKCIAMRRPVFVGDSRIRELFRHIQFWLGNPPEMTHMPLEVPLHFGLEYFFGSEAHKTVLKEALEGRSIIINSLLHDMAELGRFGHMYTNVGNVLQYLGPDACPKDCQPEDSAVKCNCRKTYAPHRYVANIQRLKALFETVGREERSKGSGGGGSQKYTPFTTPTLTPHFWVSLNRKPPGGIIADRVYSWQTTDVLMELEDYAYKTLEGAGVGHIDFRPHLMSAPVEWWKDMVHYGSNNTSFMQHMSFQVLLNRLCPLDTAGGAATAVP